MGRDETRAAVDYARERMSLAVRPTSTPADDDARGGVTSLGAGAVWVVIWVRRASMFRALLKKLLSIAALTWAVATATSALAWSITVQPITRAVLAV